MSVRWRVVVPIVTGVLAGCSGGSGGELTCVAGASCAPSGTRNPCQTYLTECASPSAAATCRPAGDAAEGTPCGSGWACEAGACAPLPPVAVADAVTIHDGAPVAVDVLANDISPSGLRLQVAWVESGAPWGTASIVGDEVVFTPADPEAVFEAELSYVVADGAHVSAGSTITITSARTVSLAGRIAGAQAPGAQVTAACAGRTAQAQADATGAYALALDVADAEAPIVLSAAGAPASGQGGVALARVVGTLTSLRARLPSPLAVTSTTDPSADLTPLSTAHYGALLLAGGGALPGTTAELVAAEKSVPAGQLVEVAAAVKLAIDSAEAFPLAPGTSTLDLSTDPSLLASYLAGVAASPGGAAALDAARAATVSDAPGRFGAPATVTLYDFVPAAQPGFLARGGESFTLSPDGTGLFAGTWEAMPFTWTVLDGSLSLHFPAPLTYSDAVLLAEVPAPGGETIGCDEPFVTRTDAVSDLSLRLLVSGTAVDWVERTERGTTTWGPFCGPYTVTADYARDLAAEVRDGVKTPAIEPTPSLVVGEWMLYSYYAVGEYFDGFTDVARLNGDLVTFAADGSGSAALSGRSLTWRLVGPDLVLTFADGSSQRVRFLEELGGTYGAYYEARSPEGAVLASLHDYAFKRDPGLVLDAPALVTGAASYWQSFVATWSPTAWTQGRLNADMRFGFELDADGTGFQWLGDANGNGLFDHATEGRAVGWSLSADQLALSLAAGGDGAARQRLWTPAFFSPDGNAVQVLEAEYRRWSPSEPYLVYIPPRLAPYRKLAP